MEWIYLKQFLERCQVFCFICSISRSTAPISLPPPDIFLSAGEYQNYCCARHVANYPAVTATDQTGLRTRLRRERRVEFMREGLRYQDLIRWRIAEKALDRLLIGLPEPADQDRSEWPFNDEILPTIDQDGVVLFDAPALIANNYARLLQDYDFDENRMYLWPIPASDRLLNSSLSQNKGY